MPFNEHHATAKHDFWGFQSLLNIQLSLLTKENPKVMRSTTEFWASNPRIRGLISWFLHVVADLDVSRKSRWQQMKIYTSSEVFYTP